MQITGSGLDWFWRSHAWNWYWLFNLRLETFSLSSPSLISWHILCRLVQFSAFWRGRHWVSGTLLSNDFSGGLLVPWALMELTRFFKIVHLDLNWCWISIDETYSRLANWLKILRATVCIRNGGAWGAHGNWHQPLIYDLSTVPFQKILTGSPNFNYGFGLILCCPLEKLWGFSFPNSISSSVLGYAFLEKLLKLDSDRPI